MIPVYQVDASTTKVFGGNLEVSPLKTGCGSSIGFW